MHAIIWNQYHRDVCAYIGKNEFLLPNYFGLIAELKLTQEQLFKIIEDRLHWHA